MMDPHVHDPLSSFNLEPGTTFMVPDRTLMFEPSVNAARFRETPVAYFLKKVSDLYHFRQINTGTKNRYILFAPANLVPGTWLSVEWFDKDKRSAGARLATEEEVREATEDPQNTARAKLAQVIAARKAI